MAETTYTYSIANDMPGGKVNPARLTDEIKASAITIALVGVSTNGDVLDIIFKAPISTEEITILDGDQTGPAGGLLAAHDNSPTVSSALPVEFLKPQLTWPKPVNIGDRLWEFSMVFTHKTTWWPSAIRVVNELVGTGDGTTKEFLLAHPFVIDLNHGLVSEERKIVPSTEQGGTTFIPEIKVDGVIQDETQLGFLTTQSSSSSSSSSADPVAARIALADEQYADQFDPDAEFHIDYRNGIIHFFDAPANGAEIRATYFYSPLDAGSEFYLTPPAGKVFQLTDVEIQFTEDLILTDAVGVVLQMYLPQYAPPPTRFDIPQSAGIYKGIHDFVNWSRGAFPVIPVCGGSMRGNKSPIVQLRFQYQSPVELYPSYGMRFKVALPRHRPFRGSYAAMTFYGVTVDEVL